MTHCINGYLTDNHIEYLLEPTKTSMVISDITQLGYWDNVEFDKHITQCLVAFTNIINDNPAIITCMQSSRVIFSSLGPIHPELDSLLKENDVSYEIVSPNHINYGSSYAPPRNILVWGIHADLCILDHSMAITRYSNITRAIILEDATQSLRLDRHDGMLLLSRHLPNIDVVSKNARFVI